MSLVNSHFCMHVSKSCNQSEDFARQYFSNEKRLLLQLIEIYYFLPAKKDAF